MKRAYTQKEIDGLVEMSNAESRFDLYDIGSKDAALSIAESHFPGTFKIIQ
jgi:uncharacterized protein